MSGCISSPDAPALVGELEVHDAPVVVAAPPAHELLLLEPVEHPCHRAAVDVAFARERGDRVGALEQQQQDRLPLHRGELERLHVLIDAADERREHLLDQPADRAECRLGNGGGTFDCGPGAHERKCEAGGGGAGRLIYCHSNICQGKYLLRAVIAARVTGTRFEVAGAARRAVVRFGSAASGG